MPTRPTQTVFVILTGAEAPPGLARAAVRNSWPILDAPLNRAQLEQALDRHHSSVVIIHVPAAADPALHLIGTLRASRRCSVVVAVSTATTEEAEIRARAAGAGLFLPASADADVVERTVLALNVTPRRAAGAATTVTKAIAGTRRASTR